MKLRQPTLPLSRSFCDQFTQAALRYQFAAASPILFYRCESVEPTGLEPTDLVAGTGHSIPGFYATGVCGNELATKSSTGRNSRHFSGSSFLTLRQNVPASTFIQPVPILFSEVFLLAFAAAINVAEAAKGFR